MVRNQLHDDAAALLAAAVGEPSRRTALKAALDDPAALAQRAEAARASGIADAAERLADLVLHVAKLENKNEAAA